MTKYCASSTSFVPKASLTSEEEAMETDKEEEEEEENSAYKTLLYATQKEGVEGEKKRT